MAQIMTAKIKTGRPDPEEKAQFDMARQSGTIQDLVAFVQNNPKSALLDRASEAILWILTREYPSYKYRTNITASRLPAELVEALEKGKPLVVTFAPREVPRGEPIVWTTHFIEIAGVGATLHDMVPNIATPGAGVWRATGGSLDKLIEIEPFGRACHEWSCWGGPWRGSNVTLGYFGCYGPSDRLIYVHSYATFAP